MMAAAVNVLAPVATPNRRMNRTRNQRTSHREIEWYRQFVRAGLSPAFCRFAG